MLKIKMKHKNKFFILIFTILLTMSLITGCTDTASKKSTSSSLSQTPDVTSSATVKN